MRRRFLYPLSGMGAIALAAAIALQVGPRLEARFWPIRVDQVIENIHRDSRMVRFTWVSTKLRAPNLEGLTVFLFSQSDRFVVILYRDLSPPDEPCTEMIPIAESRRVGVGQHSLQYCVEVPHTVNATDRLRISVISRYRGLLGLWDLPQTMPDVDVPIDLAGT